jgi:hypothetical protein
MSVTLPFLFQHKNVMDFSCVCVCVCVCERSILLAYIVWNKEIMWMD